MDPWRRGSATTPARLGEEVAACPTAARRSGHRGEDRPCATRVGVRDEDAQRGGAVEDEETQPEAWRRRNRASVRAKPEARISCSVTLGGGTAW